MADDYEVVEVTRYYGNEIDFVARGVGTAAWQDTLLELVTENWVAPGVAAALLGADTKDGQTVEDDAHVSDSDSDSDDVHEAHARVRAAAVDLLEGRSNVLGAQDLDQAGAILGELVNEHSLDAVMRSGEAMGRLEDPLAPVASLVVERVTPAEAWNQHSYHLLNDPSLEPGELGDASSGVVWGVSVASVSPVDGAMGEANAPDLDAAVPGEGALYYRSTRNQLVVTDRSFSAAQERFGRLSAWRNLGLPDHVYPRFGAACGFGGGFLYCFGGMASTTGTYSGQARVNTVSRFSVEEETWETLEVSGDCPAPRSSAAGCCHGNYFYVHGGYAGSVRYGDFFRLDLRAPADQMAWELVPVTGGADPGIRSLHRLMPVGDSLYVLGGSIEDGDPYCADDMWRFDTVASTWHRIDIPIPITPRSGYTAFSHRGDIYYLWGWNGKGGVSCFSDSFVYHTETETWEPYHVPEEICPRTVCGAGVIGDWAYLYGGRVGSHYCSDMYVLHVPTSRWRQIPSDAHKLGMRTAFFMGAHLGSLWVFSGFRGTGKFAAELSTVTIYPHPWRPSRAHRLFPLEFRRAAMAVLMMAQSNPADGTPRHPEAPFHTLPFEVLCLILETLADLTVFTNSLEA